MRVRMRVRACGWGKDPLLGRPMLSLAKVGQVAIFPIAVTKVSFNPHQLCRHDFKRPPWSNARRRSKFKTQNCDFALFLMSKSAD